MSDDDVRRIYLVARRSLKQARNRYAETFKRAVTDPSILAELEARFQDRSGDDVVALPAELVLAVLLRPGGRREGRPRSIREALSNERAVLRAQRLKAEEGLTAKAAAEKAKTQVRCRISAKTILDRMYRPRVR